MSPALVVVSNLTGLLLLSILAGLVVRRRMRLCWSFSAYVALVFITDRLITWWPGTFYVQAFWGPKETVLAIVKMLIALELARLVFQRLVRAQRAAGVFLGATLLTVAVWIAVDGRSMSMAEMQGWLQVGATWTFTVLLLLVVWYHIPLHPWHRAIMLGFVLYLGVYGLVLSGWIATGELHPQLSALEPAAYAATCGLWATAAWRPEPASALSPEAKRFLRPWLQS